MKFKKILFTLMFFLILPISVNASGGLLKQDSITECNGIKYGYHGSDKHYHKAILRDEKWYADGDIVTDICNKSTDSVDKSENNNEISTKIVEDNFKNETESTTSVDKDVVTLSKCVDGDTTHFNLNGEDITVRYLAINTPESTTKKEFYGKEASNYVCNKLKNASKIELEYDSESDKLDKYDRVLAWVIVDGEVLQKDLVKNGYAEVKYIYGDYKYLDDLEKLEKEAKSKKLGMWQNYKEDYSKYIYIGIGVILIIILLILKKKRSAKKILNKISKKIK